MKSMSVGVAGRQLGLAMALVLSVALATLLFSFLGTIACGALVGMMLGALRRWRWWVIFVSLVFPLVMAVFLHFSRTDLTDKQMTLLPIVCFGSFWLTYLPTCVLLRFEKQSEPATSEPAAIRAEPQPQPASGAAAPGLSGVPGLDELQGTWVQAASASAGLLGCKRLEFVRERFVVSVVSGGRTRRLAEGNASVEKLGPFAVLRLLSASPADPTVAPRPEALPATWIYRLSGSTLILAANFDQAAGGEEPRLETYARPADQPGGVRDDSQRRATD